MILRKHLISPGRLVLVSIFFAICIGTILLMLPISQRIPISIIDCFFTATSSICVTGILTIPISSFTTFGKVIILILVQLGGIGLISLTIFLISLFTNLGIATKLMVEQLLELEDWQKTKQILFFIIFFTLIIESIGTTIFYFILRPMYSQSDALLNACFHSIASFCSAGLSIFGNNLYAFKTNSIFLIITSILILFGTLGFITWYELIQYSIAKIQKKRMTLSLTTKVVLSTTFFLILAAIIMLGALEIPEHFQQDTWIIRIINLIFNAISYRSTGFSTIDPQYSQAATIFLILMYSLIGSSPGSTGSGIKVTTFSIFLATIKSVMSGRTVVDLKGRRIPQDQIFKAVAILALSFCWIILSTFVLLLLESNKSFGEIFFTTVSSFTTLGLMGNVEYLSAAGKILISLNMYIGRLGSLTFILALRPRPERIEFQYPEERIMIS